MAESTLEGETHGSDIDPIWTTSRTARQIYALGEVDKVQCLNILDTRLLTKTKGHHQAALFGCLIHLPPNSTSNGWS